MNPNIQASTAQKASIVYGVSFATSNNLNLVGGNETAKNICNPLGRLLHTSEMENIAHTTPEISLISLNIDTGENLSHSTISTNIVENQQALTKVIPKAFYQEPYERLTSLNTLSNGTFIISSVAHTQEGNFNRLLFVNSYESGQIQKSLKVWGFKHEDSTLENLLETEDGKLVGIISIRGGIPPFELVTIDSETGKVNYDELVLPDLLPDRRYSNLTQSPVDRKIYAISMDHMHPAHLVQLDMENYSGITGKPLIIKLSELHLNNKVLENDLLGLAFSPLGKLYAIANINREPINSLFTVDIDTGEMVFVRKLAVLKIAFA
ncbi:MAG: hypothetical protein RMZ41_022495 [Nostoc sp. DedVER02]|uniref:hypothetical protein n=1 Tax=unclassified Nostoc TaxID=2593658 RepID=UPI002AD3ED97|nr:MULTISPECIES: hypothetical protein [unclassified Nostoc]MDZ7987418.1 hypothetical protein [Nostoc sp. DedVER02]MDZ8116652.1 hypothetical protein [Nostoc sp. DedVER01b]